MHLTPFEWALILGISSVIMAMISGMIGFFVVRLIKSVDKLDETLEKLSTELLTNYVRKDDFKSGIASVRTELTTAINNMVDRMNILHDSISTCKADDCTFKGRR